MAIPAIAAVFLAVWAGVLADVKKPQPTQQGWQTTVQAEQMPKFQFIVD